MKRSYLMLLPAALACGHGISEVGEGEGDEAVGAVEEVAGAKEDHTLVRPVGTFDGTNVYAGQFSKLVLMTDRTFHAETVIYCFTTPCIPPGTNGSYYYWRNSYGTRFVRLGSLGSYAYSYYAASSPDTLKLRKINTSTWFSLTRASQPWCADKGDCGAQNLAHIMCAIGPLGGWKCEQNSCGYLCGGWDPCASVRCASGTHCVASGASASCVPDGGTCRKGGCSGQLCYDPATGSGISTCEFRPEYACYRTAECKRQSDNKCGWTQSAALLQCISNAGNN